MQLYPQPASVGVVMTSVTPAAKQSLCAAPLDEQQHACIKALCRLEIATARFARTDIRGTLTR